MTGVSIRIEGREKVLATLEKAIAKTEQPRDLFDAIGAMLVTSTQHRFEAETDPEGNPWPPSIRVLTTGGKTLTDTAALVGSITHEADNAGVAVGTNLIYAATHQLGATIKPVNAKRLAFSIGGRQVFATQVTIPARPFLGIDDEDASAIEEIAAEWLGAELVGA